MVIFHQGMPSQPLHGIIGCGIIKAANERHVCIRTVDQSADAVQVAMQKAPRI